MKKFLVRIVMGMLLCLVAGGIVEAMKQQNQNVLSAISKALDDDNTEEAGQLIKKWVTQGGDVNAKIHIEDENKIIIEIPLLLVAIIIKNPATVELLLDKKAAVDTTGPNNTTPLIAAVCNKSSIEIIQLLLKNGAIVDKQDTSGTTALMMAKTPDVASLLLQSGADIEKRDSEGRTALDHAKCSPDVYKVLQEELNKKHASLFSHYRNLIVIMEKGDELLGDQPAMLNNFILALNNECAFILISAAMWDYFLHAKIKVDEEMDDARNFFKNERWNVYQICITQKAVADFYLLCPISYKNLLLRNQAVVDLGRSLKEKSTLDELKNLDETSFSLGFALYDKINNPLEKQGSLGTILEITEQQINNLKAKLAKTNQLISLAPKQNLTGEIPQKAQDLKTTLPSLEEARQDRIDKVFSYAKNLDTHLGEDFLKCLKQLLIFNKFKSIELPKYNVYISGHGSPLQPTPELGSLLDSLMQRAQKTGYWPGDISSKLSSAEVQQFQTDQKHAAELIMQQPIEERGSIAALPVHIFGKTLELFNNATNFLFVTTCYGGGIHLTLPFIFMSTPQIFSYTLINQALLATPVDLPKLPISKEREKESPYSIAFKQMSFKKFFDGISDFHYFIQREEPNIRKNETLFKKTQPRNYFSRLLNYVANFLESDGKIPKFASFEPGGSVKNIPWIKLPGPTNWQMVQHMDDESLIISDVMIRAKRLELNPSEQGQIALGEIFKNKRSQQAKKSEPTKKPAAWSETQWTSWKERWGKWDKERVSIQPSLSIKVGNKKLIFVTINKIPLRLEFDKSSAETKAIIPLAQQASISDVNVLTFDEIYAKETFTFADFFNQVLKPKQPLVKLPSNTLFFIKKLVCSDISYTNCLVPFEIPELSDSFYYSDQGKILEMKEITEAPHEASFDWLIKNPALSKKSRFFDVLMQIDPQESSGVQAFIDAIHANDIEQVKRLLSHKIDPNAKEDSGGRSLLLIAAQKAKNDLEIVKLLIQAGANINEMAYSMTALSWAISGKNKNFIKLLIQAGADVRIGNFFKYADPEIKKFIATLLTPQSSGFKKELQTFQQAVARDVWQQPAASKSSIKDTIQRGLPAFKAKLPELIRQTEVELGKDVAKLHVFTQ